MPGHVNPAAELAYRYPGVLVWYGRYTGAWWAYVPGRPPRLVEAPDPHQLAARLFEEAARRRAVPRRPGTARPW